MRQIFQQEEAEQILQEAVRREVQQVPGSAVTPAVSHERLLAMAEELGISPAALNAVLQDRQVQAEREREAATVAQLRKEFITERRAGFLPNLYTFLGTNVVILAINLLTNPYYPWFVWPLLLWGLALYLHAVSALPTRGPNFEHSLIGYRERRTRRQEEEAKKRAEESMRMRETTTRQAAEAELDE